MALRFLHFDFSEATDGCGSFDTMASASPAQWPALQAELALVLAWAEQAFPAGRGPLDEGFHWDFDLQATQERTRQERLQWDPAGGGFLSELAGGESLRHTVSLSLGGDEAFCAAFRERFAPEEDA